MPENKPNNDNITKAFEPDYLNRKALAVEWTDALLSTKINHHLVISVSGDWGTGKTYLAKNWYKYLEEQEYFTCYIDAHKKDYAEDPLLIIMSEIESYVNKHVKKENGAIKEAFEKVKDSFLPFLTSGFKTAVKVGAGILLPDIISSNISKIIDSIDGEKLKEIIKGSIDEYNNKKDSRIEEYYDNIKVYSENIEEFKQALEKFADTIADKLNKPVVIFIDELDRSNPQFVIKLIEQLKHIFEIPNLAFILTVNKKELSNTIEGIYGSKMDGYAYYKKFTTHDFTLYPIEQIKSGPLEEFIENMIADRSNFNVDKDFISLTALLSQILRLSLRDIEQIIHHLYYIKEKVYQSYHRDYLIICYFLRALYLKNYTNFLLYSELSIVADDSLIAIKEKEPTSKLNHLVEELMNGEYGQSDLLNIIKLILAPITDDTINNFFEAHRIDVIWPPITGTNTFHEAEKYIYYPILTHGYDEYDIPIPCRTSKEVKERILSIRKNLIQLSMLGAVPKDNH